MNKTIDQMPIDAVYTWVDGSDPLWIKKRDNAVNQNNKVSKQSVNIGRYKDNKELKYSIRSLHKFAPWIKKIFIVTDNQVPDWLKISDEKIKIVDHTEIFKGKGKLPTFNSKAIEARIHHIEGLSEHFLYFNDDVFLGKPCSKNTFFNKSGKPIYYVSQIIPFPSRRFLDISYIEASKQNEFQYGAINSRKLIYNKYRKLISYDFRHGVKSFIKSDVFKLEKIFKPQLGNTINHNFRTNQDILIHALYGFYGIKFKKVVPKYIPSIKPKMKSKEKILSLISKHRYAYINLDEDDVKEYLKIIEHSRPFMFCLNQYYDTPQKILDMMDSFLESFFPQRSPYEK